MDHFLSLDPTSLTFDLLEEHLLAAETSAVAVGAARGTPRTPFFEGCSPSPLAPSYASNVPGAEDVAAASASAKNRSSKGKGGKGGGVGSGSGGGGSSGGSGGGGGGGGGGTGGGGGGSGGGGAARGTPRTPFFEGCSPSPLAPSYASNVPGAEDVAAASASAKNRSSKGKGGKGGGVGSGSGGGGSSGGSGGGGGGGGGGTGGGGGGSGTAGGGGSSGSGGNGGGGTSGGRTSARRGGSRGGQRQQQQRPSETQSPQQLREWLFQRGSSGGSDSCPYVIRTDPLRSGVAIFDQDFDVILSTMYALSVSAEGDCYRCVPPDPSIAAAALSASESSTLPGTTPTEALHTFTLDSGSSLYTLATESPQVVASAQVSVSGQVAPPCSCRLLWHETLLWHPSLGYPSLPRLRGMHSCLLVFGLPRSLPPLPPSPAPPCLPCIEGRQCAAPHSSSFPPTTAPLQTLHIDVWGPAHVSGQGRERYFLLVVDDYTRYTTVFPLRSKGERRIGLVMEVAPTSMIHAAAPHFLWPFAVQYAVHQLNLWPHVSLPETSPTLRWTGKVGYASVFRVWGSRAFVGDTSADKLSARAIPCVFLGSVPDAPGWHRFPFTVSAPLPPPPLFLALRPPPVDPLPPQGLAPSRVSHVDPPPSNVPGEVAPGGAETGSAEPGGAETGGAEPGGAETGGADPVLLVIHRDCLRSSCVSGLFDAHAFRVELPELEALEPLEQEVLKLLLELVVPGVLRLPVLEVLVPEVLELLGLVVLGALELDTLQSLELPELEALALVALELVELVALGLEALELEELELEALAQEALELVAQELEELELLTLEALCGRNRTSFPCFNSVTTSCTLWTSAQIFLQGSLHEEIWLRRPPGFTGSFPAGPQWSLRWPVYCLRQVLQCFNFLFSSPQPTPLSTGHSLSASPLEESIEPSGPYPELVGCLITSGMGLVLGGRGPFVLTGHVDASWQRGQLRLAYVATRANTADIFFKALPPGDHQHFSTVLGLNIYHLFLASHCRLSLPPHRRLSLPPRRRLTLSPLHRNSLSPLRRLSFPYHHRLPLSPPSPSPPIPPLPLLPIKPSPLPPVPVVAFRSHPPSPLLKY
ncbi:unnamed protein product [Closterium sp. NIES-53]